MTDLGTSLETLSANGIRQTLDILSSAQLFSSKPLFVVVPEEADQAQIIGKVALISGVVFGFSDLANKDRVIEIKEQVYNSGNRIAAYALNYQDPIPGGRITAQDRYRILKDEFPIRPRSLILSTCLPDIESFTKRGSWHLNPLCGLIQISPDGWIQKLVVKDDRLKGLIFFNESRFKIEANLLKLT